LRGRGVMVDMAADYYSALVRAVSRLANNNVQARQELYEHARSNIVAQLRRRDLRISDEEIARQRSALETAISRVEGESLSPKTDTPPHHGHTDTAIGRERFIERKTKSESASVISVKREAKSKNIEMAEMPEWLGAMLIRIALVVAIIVSAGLMYLAQSRRS
jgi:hypothetical protein